MRSCLKRKVLGKEFEYIGERALGHLPALGTFQPWATRQGASGLEEGTSSLIWAARCIERERGKKDDAQLNLNFM